MAVPNTPDFVAARDHVVTEVISFARTLRANGVSVPANASLSATEALVETGFDDRTRVRAAMHATLVSGPRDTEVFETHFPVFWYRLRTGLEAMATEDQVGEESASTNGQTVQSPDGTEAPTVPGDAAGDGDDTTVETETRSRRLVDSGADLDPDESDEQTRAMTYSATASTTPVEDESVGTPLDPAALRRFERALATLSGRRWTAGASGHRLDARRAIRESVETGGVALSLPTRERRKTEFRCSVLVDVSQSVLDTIDRGFLLSFLNALVRDGRGVRVFFFDTDIQDVTPIFSRASGDAAAALERAQVEWGGGTRIGESLGSLRRRWPDAVDHRTVTLVVSDGLDVGEVDRLEDELVWLSRRSGPILWLNPLAASVAYEPTCRGMDAALPYIDGLFAFSGSSDLSDIARQLERHGPFGPVGYEHDFRERPRGDSMA
ncbi:MAG: vWA domain-containing protein [Halobacteriota archaeon]